MWKRAVLIAGVVLLAAGAGFLGSRLGRQPVRTVVHIQPSVVTPSPAETPAPGMLVAWVDGSNGCVADLKSDTWTLRKPGPNGSTGDVLAVSDYVHTREGGCGLYVRFRVAPTSTGFFMVVDEQHDTRWGPFDLQRVLASPEGGVSLRLDN